MYTSLPVLNLIFLTPSLCKFCLIRSPAFVKKPSLVKRLGDFFSRVISGAANKNTTGQDVKPTDVSFKDGQDLYDFVRGYVRDSESGVLSERAKELAERGRGQQGAQSAARKLTPEQEQLAQDKVKEIQELQKEGEA